MLYLVTVQRTTASKYTHTDSRTRKVKPYLPRYLSAAARAARACRMHRKPRDAHVINTHASHVSPQTQTGDAFSGAASAVLVVPIGSMPLPETSLYLPSARGSGRGAV